MADYLIHFNKNHDPKTGRFTFGISRYHNPDGSLTEAGKKHYQISEKKANKMIEADKKGKFVGRTTHHNLITGETDTRVVPYVQDRISDNKAVKRFNKLSPERKEYVDAYYSKNELIKNLNEEANREAAKAVGLSNYPYKVVMMKVFGKNADPKVVAKYIEAGKAHFNSKESLDRLQKANERFNKASKEYEKVGRKLVEDILGEYGNNEMQGALSVKYDLKTKKISQQTLTDNATALMLKEAREEANYRSNKKR